MELYFTLYYNTDEPEEDGTVVDPQDKEKLPG